MRFRGRSGAADAARTRRAALLLLLLTLHAVQASATHFHRLSRALQAQAERGPSVGQSRGGRDATEAGGHAECVLCRLQRGLFEGLTNSQPAAFAPPQDFRRVEIASAGDHSGTPPGVSHGRAPPLS